MPENYTLTTKLDNKFVIICDTGRLDNLSQALTIVLILILRELKLK